MLKGISTLHNFQIASSLRNGSWYRKCGMIIVNWREKTKKVIKQIVPKTQIFSSGFSEDRLGLLTFILPQFKTGWNGCCVYLSEDELSNHIIIAECAKCNPRDANCWKGDSVNIPFRFFFLTSTGGYFKNNFKAPLWSQRSCAYCMHVDACIFSSTKYNTNCRVDGSYTTSKSISHELIYLLKIALWS